MKYIIKTFIEGLTIALLIAYLVACVAGAAIGLEKGVASLKGEQPCPYPNIASKVVITYPITCELLEKRS